MPLIVFAILGAASIIYLVKGKWPEPKPKGKP